MLFRPRYGRVGWLVLPTLWIFEFFTPVVELTGYSTIFLAAVLGLLGRQFRVLFLILGYACPTLISIGSVLLDEMTYRRYSHWREVARLLLYCLFEDFPLPANNAVLAVAEYLAVPARRSWLEDDQADSNLAQ